VKNINLTVDESTFAKAETFAALNKTSVTNLLLDYLHEVTSTPLNREAARARLIELSNAAKGEVGKRDWKRDDLYDR
jgi:hypothetical protein